MQKTCIIIPCYNEELRFPVKEFLAFYNISPWVCFCFVNDGSSDNTLKVLKELTKGREERISILDLIHNQGKAEAIRQGVYSVLRWKNFSHVGYFDADLSTPLSEINNLLSVLEQNIFCIMAFGARVKLLGRSIERNSIRHYFGRIFSTISSIILNLPVYDTQCGAKILKTEVASELFSKKFISPWLFDIELFARIIEKYGIERSESLMIEVPLIKWVDKGGSKLKLKHLVRVPLELLKILLVYRLKSS